MKKLTTLIIILFSLPVLLAGLQSCGDDCPSGKIGEAGKYKLISGYNSFFYESDSTGNRTKIYKEFDTLSINKPLKLNLNFNTEYVAFADPVNNQTSMLMACSEPPALRPNPTQKISDIIIITKYKLGNIIETSDTLNTYTSHIQRSNISPFNEIYLPLFTLTNAMAEQELKLILTPPQAITEVTPFQIEVFLKLSDGSLINITSPKIYLGIN